MQILPTTSNSILSLTESYFIGADFQGAAGESFAEELYRQQMARDAVSADEIHSVQVALESTPQVNPLSQAPYNLTSDNGVTYTTEEVIFTQQEIEDLERDLRRQGAPAESLEELNKLAEQPGGSTLGEVMIALQNQRDYPLLSTDESETLKRLTAKIDSTGTLYSTLMGHLSNRNGKEALDALVQGMSNLNGGSTIFTKEELSVLTKSMGISEDATNKILGTFGSAKALKLNQAELATVLAPAVNDFATEASNLKKLGTAVDKVLDPLLQEAKERMAAEKTATELSSRKSEQSKVMIEKTVLENVNSTLEGTRTSQLDAQLEKQQEDAKLTKDTLDLKLAGNKDFSQDQSQDNAKDAFTNNESKSDAWSQLMDKTSVRTSDTAAIAATTKNITTPVIGIGGLASTNAQLAQNLANSQQAQRANLASQAAAQVEKAMLSAARDGSKSLELQLHPAELGTLSITLTARNGEVSALLRSERPETAEMLQKQMDQIRAHLEEQGIKIDKIEVRQGSQENTASHDMWNGMNEHNARQEENAQREMLDRLRNLGKVRNNGVNSQETALEHNMHNMDSSARNAAQTLYVVA